MSDGRRDFRFVHVSTDEVFGALDAAGTFTTASPYRPTSPYAASKAASDHFARAWRQTYGLPVIVTNCSNNYGPYQYPDKLIPLVIRKALAGDAIPVYGTGRQVRDWVHVEDHVRGLVAALERGGRPGRPTCSVARPSARISTWCTPSATPWTRLHLTAVPGAAW